MAESKLLGADGRPVTSESPLAAVSRSPIRDRGSYVEVDKAALATVQRERARKLAITSIPSTPRDMIRDIGGLAVGKGHGRWPHVTFDMLRELRERAPILQPIHQARAYQVRALAQKWSGKRGTVGFRVVHKDYTEHNAKTPDGFDRHIKRFESVLWRPAPSYDVHTLGAALSMLIEDLMTINRPVVELIPSLIDPGRIVQWRPVDGALIWPTLQWLEKWVADNPRWSLGYDRGRLRPEDQIELVSNAIGQDLFGAEFVLVRDGLAEAVYPNGRLKVAPLMNRTDVRFAGYPPSHVEQAIALVSAFISAFDYNTANFTKGMMAEFILGLPADMHDDDIDAFADMFREATQGTARAHQPPILPLPHGKDTIQKIDLKRPNNEMGWTDYMSMNMSLAAAIYRMDMAPLNGKPWDGGAGPKLSEGSRIEEISLAKEEGLQGDVGHLCDTILTPMAMACHPDLRVIAEYGNYDPEKEARVYELRANNDMTRNEVRMQQGLEPMGFWLPPDEYDDADDATKQKFDDNVWNWPKDPVFANAIGQAKSRDQQAQMMAQQQAGQGPQPGDPHEDGFGGYDDGFGGAHPAHDPSPYGAPQGAPQPGGAPSGGAPRPPGPGGAAPMAKAVRTVQVRIHDDADTGGGY